MTGLEAFVAAVWLSLESWLSSYLSLSSSMSNRAAHDAGRASLDIAASVKKLSFTATLRCSRDWTRLYRAIGGIVCNWEWGADETQEADSVYVSVWYGST